MICLEYACKVFGVEQKELAEKLKIAPPNISAWLKGTREIPTKYLPELSKIFNGLSPDYFQRELTYVDELKIRIYYIEKVLSWEDRHDELKIFDDDNGGKLLYDLTEDDYANELKRLYSELNKTIKIDSYQDRIQSLFERLEALDTAQQAEIFREKNAEDFILAKLNTYLDFLLKFQVRDIAAVDSIINYFVNYHGHEKEKWNDQELFPNEKLLAFYSDLEEVLAKYKVI